MKKILTVLLFLIYLTLSITNQLQFSLLVSNLIPVRFFLTLFLTIALGIFIYRERLRSLQVFWQFVKSDRFFQVGLLLLMWRALSLSITSDVAFGLTMLAWWASILAFYFLGN